MHPEGYNWFCPTLPAVLSRVRGQRLTSCAASGAIQVLPVSPNLQPGSFTPWPRQRETCYRRSSSNYTDAKTVATARREHHRRKTISLMHRDRAEAHQLLRPKQKRPTSPRSTKPRMAKTCRRAGDPAPARARRDVMDYLPRFAIKEKDCQPEDPRTPMKCKSRPFQSAISRPSGLTETRKVEGTHR